MAFKTNAMLLVQCMGIPEALEHLAEEHGLKFLQHGVAEARNKCMDRLESMIGEHFSDEDVAGLLAFYQTDLGRRFASKQGDTFKDFASIIDRFLLEAGSEVT